MLGVWLTFALACGSETKPVGDIGADIAHHDQGVAPVDIGADGTPEVDTSTTDSGTMDAPSGDSVESDLLETDTDPSDVSLEDTSDIDAELTDADSNDAMEDSIADIALDIPPSDTVADVEEPGPAIPFDVSEEIEPVWAEVLEPNAATWVSLSPDGTTLLAGGVDALWMLTDEGTTPLVVDEVFDPSTVSAAVGLPDGHFLVVADGGLYLAGKDAVLVSPLSEFFEETEVVGLQAGMVDGALVLWFAAGDELHYWKDGLIFSVSPEGLSTTEPRLALEPNGRLWVASDGVLFRLEPTDEGFEAWVEQEELSVEHLAVDSLGNLWVQQSDNVLLRTPDAEWFDLAELSLKEVSASVMSAQVWFSDQVSLMRLANTLLRPTDGPADIVASQVDNEGRLVIASAEGIIRVHPGRSVSLEGLPEEGYVTQEIVLTVKPDLPELVTNVAVSISGQKLTVEDDGSFTLSPGALGSGSYVIEIVVTYSDIETLTKASYGVSVMYPTWIKDIFPLSEAKCGGCHGENAAVKAKYFTKEHWVTSYDSILFMVSPNGDFAPAMPPGDPLEEELLEQLIYWKDVGFP